MVDRKNLEFKRLNILIVGLGLIGASIAMALRESGCSFVDGIDTNPEVINDLKNKKIINNGWVSAEGALKDADLTIICLYPSETAKFILDNKDNFKSGSVVTDVSGVKADLIKIRDIIETSDFAFVGGHPMAGKEVGGYMNADPGMFNLANFIITPFRNSTDLSILIVETMAIIIGCGKVRRLTPEEHDITIAFTSQLAHIIAAAMCQNSLDYKTEGFTGGSFKDLTRVAEINENLWGGVLNTNCENICAVIDNFQGKLEEAKQIILKKDNSIYEYLRETKNIKRGLK